jgi:hypothetical protein
MPTNRVRRRRRPVLTTDQEIMLAYLERRAPVGVAEDEAFLRLYELCPGRWGESNRDYRRRLRTELRG